METEAHGSDVHHVHRTSLWQLESESKPSRRGWEFLPPGYAKHHVETEQCFFVTI